MLKTKNNLNFSYSLKVVDFYFLENAKILKKNIRDNTDIEIINILSISKNVHRITLGPYDNINSLKKDFYSIRALGFENIDVIKNEKTKKICNLFFCYLFYFYYYMSFCF